MTTPDLPQGAAPEPLSDPAERPADSAVEAAPKRTRLSAAWFAVAVATVLGVALIDFIVQNTRRTKVEFFGASGHIPVAVALLAAAVIGAVVVLAVGMARTTQLRLQARRTRSERRRGRKGRRTS